MTIYVAIADDHVTVRSGLHFFLAKEKDFVICGEAENGAQAVALVEQTHPDVLILDLMLPDLNGIEVIRKIKQGLFNVHIIVFSIHSEDGYVLEAMKSGAVGYLSKESGSDALVSAVRAVMNDTYYFSSEISKTITNIYPPGLICTRESK